VRLVELVESRRAVAIDGGEVPRELVAAVEYRSHHAALLEVGLVTGFLQFLFGGLVRGDGFPRHLEQGAVVGAKGAVGEQDALARRVNGGRRRVRQHRREVLAGQVAAGELAAAGGRNSRERQERGCHVDVARQRPARLPTPDVRVDDKERNVDRL